MKSFKQHIEEEWITQTEWTGDVFKNPSPRELAEYLKNINPYGVAGIIYKKDVYVFDGMHDDGAMEIEKHTGDRLTYRNSARFRGVVRGGKIVEIGPSGGEPLDAYIFGDKLRKLLFKDMADVYTNKYLKSRMGSFEDVFEEIKKAFARDDRLEEFEQLKKKHKLK